MALKFEHLSVVDALERSIRNSKDLGARQSALVATSRVLARRIDRLADSGFVDQNGKLDNVTVPTFLKYLQALGLTVESADKVQPQSGRGRQSPSDALESFRRQHTA